MIWRLVKTTMFIQSLVPILILSVISSNSATRYGAYCSTDIDCDHYQKCLSNICRCNQDQRRFWTGKICAVCSQGLDYSFDRCYKAFETEKTWNDARLFCRERYADLVTWHDNSDEQIIRLPFKKLLETEKVSTGVLNDFSADKLPKFRAYWSAATIDSFNPYTIKWIDPTGIKLSATSNFWCDPTAHAGYQLTKQPSMQTRQNSGQIEREECVTYSLGETSFSPLCLADEFCSQKLPFICEMNAVSMQSANDMHHNNDGKEINFEEPISSTTERQSIVSNVSISTDIPAALAINSSGFPIGRLLLVVSILIVLIIGGIVAYKLFTKKKPPVESTITIEEASATTEEGSETARLSSTTFLKGMADDDELRSVQ